MNSKETQETKRFLKTLWYWQAICLVFLCFNSLEVWGEEPTAQELYDAAWENTLDHEYHLAINNYHQARILFIQKGDLVRAAYCNAGLADVYERKGDLESSYEYVQKSLALLTDLNHLQGLARVHFCLGKVLCKMKRYQQSNQAYRYTINHVDQKRFVATSLNNIGVNFRKLGLLDSAEYCHHEAIKINLQLSRPIRVAKALSNLGAVSFQRKQYQQAIQYYRQAEYLHTLGTDTLSLFKLYNRFGEAFKEIADYESALDYLLKGQLIEFHDPQEILRNRELLLEVRVLQKTMALQEEIQQVDELAKGNQKHLLMAFLLIIVLSGMVGIVYFRQQVISLNQELKHDDLVKQLHEAKLLFVRRCLRLIKPELDQVGKDLLTNNKVDAVLGLNQTRSIIEEIDSELSKN